MFDAPVEAASTQKIPKRLGRGGESARHPNAQWRELADHLAERGILPAHASHLGHAQVLQPHQILLSHRALRL